MEVRTLVFIYDLQPKKDTSAVVRISEVFGEFVTGALVVDNRFVVIKSDEGCNLVGTVPQVAQVFGEVWSIPFEKVTKLRAMFSDYAVIPIEVKNVTDGTKFHALTFASASIGIVNNEINYADTSLSLTYNMLEA